MKLRRFINDARFSILLEKLDLAPLILGGAVLQRCDKGPVFSCGFSRCYLWG